MVAAGGITRRWAGDHLLRLYTIQVWEPSATQTEVRARMASPADSQAVVVAPTKTLANQACYVIGTQDGKAQFNYQLIDHFPQFTPCVWDGCVDPQFLPPSLVEYLRSDPALPTLAGPDGPPEPGSVQGDRHPHGERCRHDGHA